jgi:hypothetical protein
MAMMTKQTLKYIVNRANIHITGRLIGLSHNNDTVRAETVNECRETENAYFVLTKHLFGFIALLP